MIRRVSAIVIFAALVAGVIGVLTWPGEAQQRTPSTSQSQIITASAPPLFDQSYTAGLRIIQVPQPGVAPQRAASKANYREELDAIDNDVDPLPSTRPRAVTTPQPRRVLPSPNAAKRTMLNAPNALHDGPSPIRPLPRWRGIEKFTELPKQATPAPAAPIADPVAAPIPPLSSPPTDNGTAASASDNPSMIDDDTPPPTD